MLNTLFGEAVAKVSKTPGRTRQINIFKVTPIFVCHTDFPPPLTLVCIFWGLYFDNQLINVKVTCKVREVNHAIFIVACGPIYDLSRDDLS